MCQSSLVVISQPLYWITAPANLAKQCFLPKSYLIPHNVVASSTKLVAHCLGRHRLVGLGQLSLVVSPQPLIVPSGKMRGLNKGPAKIAIAIFP